MPVRWFSMLCILVLGFASPVRAQTDTEFWVGTITVNEQIIVIRLNRSTAFIYQDKRIFARTLVNQTFTDNGLIFTVRWNGGQVTVTQGTNASEFSPMIPMAVNEVLLQKSDGFGKRNGADKVERILGGQSKQAIDEVSLGETVALGYSFYLSFSNHVHGLVPA